MEPDDDEPEEAEAPDTELEDLLEAFAGRNRPYEARSRRSREVRAFTVQLHRMPVKEHQRLCPEGTEHRRLPLVRSECEQGVRPCPYVSCRHHLYLDAGKLGNIKLNFPDLEPDEIPATCSLDVAALGGATLEQVAGLMNITRERVRQIEHIAFKKLEGPATEAGLVRK